MSIALSAAKVSSFSNISLFFGSRLNLGQGRDCKIKFIPVQTSLSSVYWQQVREIMVFAKSSNLTVQLPLSKTQQTTL